MRSRALHTVALLALLSAAACSKDPRFDFSASGEGSGSVQVQPREPVSPDQRSVLLYIAAGFNSLSGYLANDIEDLSAGVLPGRSSSKDPVLLVLSRLPRDLSYPDYTDPTSPVLYRLWAGSDGVPVRDTLRIWSEDTPLCRAETLSEAFEEVNKAFPGNRYGAIFSSHASGWLPPRYYDNPTSYEESGSAGKGLRSAGRTAAGPFPPLEQGEWPAVKSIGMDSGDNVWEMDLDSFAEAIPFCLDYLLFDACLMGCVEVAYQLRGKASLVGFSQAEVLAEGFVYSRLSQQLLTQNPSPQAVCQDYFNYYDAQDGMMRSATISLVDTREMEPLSQVCAALFQKYRAQLATLSGSRVQGYFRYNRHFFYDLQDILVQAGITPEEQAQLQEALDRCLVYKAATPSFLSFSIDTFSGLSMYLPSMGSSILDTYYRNHMAWNQATGLVN